MKIPWQKIGESDYLAKIGDHTFRMERMSWQNWWWCVYYKDERIADACFSDTTATNKTIANKLVKEAFETHLKLINKN